jgi:predicted ATPase
MRRYVLTGGHACGKTSILLALEEKGERVVREAASDIQRLERSRGNSFATDSPDFQNRVLQLHLQRERAVDRWHEDRVFFDRGAHDHLAYARLFHWSVQPELRDQAESRAYDAVFMVEPFGEGWQEIAGRADVRATAALSRTLREIYSGRGIPIWVVGAGTVDERARQILEFAGA